MSAIQWHVMVVVVVLAVTGLAASVSVISAQHNEAAANSLTPSKYDVYKFFERFNAMNNISFNGRQRRGPTNTVHDDYKNMSTSGTSTSPITTSSEPDAITSDTSSENEGMLIV